jgi:hypothetical protein
MGHRRAAPIWRRKPATGGIFAKAAPIQSMLSSAMMRTVSAMTVCGIAELAFDFFDQNLPVPCSAVTFDNFMRANIRMSFRSVVAHTDCYVCVERTNHRGTGSLKRVTHS